MKKETNKKGKKAPLCDKISFAKQKSETEEVLSMYESILQFAQENIKEFEKVIEKILTGEADYDDLTKEIHERVLNLGKRLQVEMLEKLDEEIRNSENRKKNWTVERRNEPKELLDVMGSIRYQRTGYVHKSTGEYTYLLDDILGIEKHQKITLGSAAKILEETIVSSYSRGGKRASETDAASKQAVKELVHKTEIDMPTPILSEKKKQRYLHVVADEDHVAAQFWKNKGDLQKGTNGQKINTIQPKLICLYEDVVNASGETSKNPRYALVGKRYFSGIYKGNAANEKLWKEVLSYIEATYDTEVLERIYISGDGAGWIKAGLDVLENSVFVLDKFHMMKYVNTSVAHLGDSIDDAKEMIWDALNYGDKKELKRVYEAILRLTENENKREEVTSAFKYFMNNWSGIRIRVTDAGGIWRCCAEGQVSHVLSDRLSSRPMGWSVKGCDQMAKFRAYQRNGGDILELLRFQKKRKKKEERIIQHEELIKELRKKQSGWKYSERFSKEIPGIEQNSMKWLRDLINQVV